MASVEPFKWNEGRACKGRTGKPKHGDDCRCKVTVWRTRWRNQDGQSRSENFDHWADATAKAAEVETDKRRGAYVDPAAGRQKFEAAAWEWAELQDWKDGTRERFPAFVKRVRPFIGNTSLDAFDKSRLERLRTQLAAKYARATVEGTMHRVHAILRQAYADGKIPRDPTVGVKAAPKLRAGERERAVSPEDVPTEDEALAILDATPSPWRAVVALGFAGLRIGERLGARKDRLNLDTGELTIDAQAQARNGRGVLLTSTKNEKTRTIELPELVVVELRRHLREGHGGTWVDANGQAHEMLFLRPDGRLWRSCSFHDQAWAPALKAVGFPRLRFKPHAQRHLCASAMLAEGVDLPTVAGYIGDTPETVMRVYAHWLRDRRDLPATVLNRIYARTSQDAAAA